MPHRSFLFLGAQSVGRRPLVQLLVLDRADCANLRVVTAELAGVVEDGMDVKARRLGAPCQFSKPQDELLLKVIGELVLRTEEDDATLGDLRWPCQPPVSIPRHTGWDVTCERAY